MIEAIHYELECALDDPAAEVSRLLDMQKLIYSPLSSICAQCLEEGIFQQQASHCPIHPEPLREAKAWDIVSEDQLVSNQQPCSAARMTQYFSLNVAYSPGYSLGECFMCRPSAPVQPVPAGSAHTMSEASLPVNPGSARGLLGLPLLQPTQCRARECSLSCPAELVSALSHV